MRETRVVRSRGWFGCVRFESEWFLECLGMFANDKVRRLVALFDKGDGPYGEGLEGPIEEK